MYKRLILQVPLTQMPAFPSTRLFNTFEPKYLSEKQRLLQVRPTALTCGLLPLPHRLTRENRCTTFARQTYLQGLARLAAPELPCSPAEQRWVDLLRRELLEFLNPASGPEAEGDHGHE